MKRTILVADDERSNLQVILNYLSEADKNYNILIAPNGKIACKIASEKLPDLILMDWIMPEMNGIDAIKQLKSQEKTKDIPILMVTAQTSSKELETALDAGAVDYIRKPIDKIELLARVKSSLDLFAAYKKIKFQNKKIEESINYAQRIQASILPDPDVIKQSFPDSFILYKVKDVVSGDFHWYFKQGDDIFIALVDCTGHGVPGALMSIMGYFLLNEVVSKGHAYDAGEILNKLHDGVVKTLGQEENVESRDGMDVTFCRINLTKKEVQFAGAHFPLIYVHRRKMAKIRGNRFPVGGMQYIKHGVTIDFTDHQLQIEEGDSIYLFSDGLPDQLGGKGDRPKSFGINQIQEIIRENMDKPLNQMAQIFDERFEVWRGNEKQLDDVLIIGIKF